MPINFSNPTVTQLRTDYASSLRDHQTALAQLLNPAVVGTVTSPPLGAQRLNTSTSTGHFEFWNGTSWAPQPVNGINYSSGNIGIGSAAPGRLVSINGGASTAYLQITNTAAGSAAANGLEIALDASGLNASIINRENGSLNFETNNLLRLVLDPTGHLSPASNGGQTLGGLVNRWATVHCTAIQDGANGAQLDSTGTTVRVAAGSAWTALNLYTGGSLRLSIDAGGNVGIPTGALTVSGGPGTFTTSGQTTTIAAVDTGAAGANLRLTGNGAVTPNKYIRSKDGNLEWVNSGYTAVIMTLSDAGALSVGNNLSVTGAASAASLSVVGAASAGSLSVTGATTAASLTISGNLEHSAGLRTYTPTLGGVVSTNIGAASVVGSTLSYERLFGRVHVHGALLIDPTAATTDTSLSISLPIASALAGITQVRGTAVRTSPSLSAGGCLTASVEADIVNDVAVLSFRNDSSTASTTWLIDFWYDILP